jgi:hypothetical protein
VIKRRQTSRPLHAGSTNGSVPTRGNSVCTLTQISLGWDVGGAVVAVVVGAAVPVALVGAGVGCSQKHSKSRTTEIGSATPSCFTSIKSCPAAAWRCVPVNWAIIIAFPKLGGFGLCAGIPGNSFGGVGISGVEGSHNHPPGDGMDPVVGLLNAPEEKDGAVPTQLLESKTEEPTVT